ncbi:DUF453-domain-containing protein [Punctularia strigosozonata HHB-11173 SS5]|uniref:DUF453-domain-containing protein n=1 Tax=Punctularia strigosozonata (strain HHB-11173) TaxID=741275 RepID=UPI0004416EF4|nr:DUF453-domain-containing protein [Punctularia strigosozonata HHB-11173 SS5]EIN09921.1 DUF453-domain-containing protein [Punctularia strigosozonata HHB-11173 SS5]
MSTVPNPLPASFLRGGTSKGIFINAKHLPADRAAWAPIFLRIMGSPDPEHGRQLDGMGGGVSSLSKVCVVGAPTPEQKGEVDVQYTFCQVGIRDATVDYSGNCGNLSSMIGPFAVDTGLVSRTNDLKLTHDDAKGITRATVRTFNTNTQKRIDCTFPVSVSYPGLGPERLSAQLDLPQTSIAGVPGQASTITLDFMAPGGARTGKLLPTGNSAEDLTLSDTSLPSVRVSLVDATNPTVFVAACTLSKTLSAPADQPIDYASLGVLEVLELIRSAGARAMALDPTAQAQPKIAVLSAPVPGEASDAHIVVHALSMGVLHRAVPMTVGLCLGVAANIEGTVAHRIVNSSLQSSAPNTKIVRIRHPSGMVDVGAEFDADGEVTSAKVVRTGRRLMTGEVWW